MSPSLAKAIQRFERFLVSDDSGRSDAITQADDETLRALGEAVTPLFNEINSVLDDLVGRPHPLPDNHEMLEYRLNALGQVGMEAQFELESRATSD